MSTDSDELVLTYVNDGQFYERRVVPAIKNLALKINKGTYDRTKALILWRHLSDTAAKLYTAEWGVKFSTADRADAAKQMQKYYEDELQHTARSLKK